MEFLSLAIVGVAVTTLVQFLKVKFGTSGFKTIGILLIVSLLAAVGYHFLSVTVYWKAFLEILAVANTIYGLLVKQLE